MSHWNQSHRCPSAMFAVPARLVLLVLLVSLLFAAQPSVALATPTPTPDTPTCGSPDVTGAWTATDIGTAATLPGTTVVAGDDIFVCGAGAQHWGTDDGLRLVYQPSTTADVTLVARVTAFADVQRFTKAGLSLRESPAAGARHVSLMVTRQDGIRLQWRAVTNGGSTDGGGTPAGALLLPTWLKLDRSGGTIRAYYSTAPAPTASDWVQVGTDVPFALNNDLLAGVFVSSRDAALLASASFSEVSLNAPPTDTTATPTTATATTTTPPATATATPPTDATATPTTATATATPPATATSTPGGNPTCGSPDVTGAWTATDIGTAATLPGTTVVAGDGIFVCGAGAQHWGTDDGLRLVYQPSTTADVTLVARVTAFADVQRFTKAGLSLRESPAAGARHVSLMVTRQDGIRLQWRAVTNGGSTDGGGTPAGTLLLPTWLKLDRSGGTIRAYYSTAPAPTASDWVQVGTDVPFALNNDLLAGVFVSSRDAALLASASFSEVSLNAPPTDATATPTTATATATTPPATATATPPATATATATPPATATATPPATATSTPGGDPTCGSPDVTGAWTATDIGTADLLPGATVVDGSDIFICGAGAQHWGTQDGLRLVYQRTTSADVTLVARIEELNEAQRYTKAGLSFRDSTNPDARHFSVIATAQDGVRVQWRDNTGGGSTDGGSYGSGRAVVPIWLKLERSGGAIRAYYSTAPNPASNNWVQVGSAAPFALNNDLLAGVFISSRELNERADASFSNVALDAQLAPTSTPTVPGAPTSTPTATPEGLLGHPRMFFSSEAEIQALRDKLNNPQANAIWQPIRTLANQYRSQLPPANSPTVYDPANFSYTDYRAYGDVLLSLAFACVIDEQPADCQAAKDYMVIFAGWDNWELGDQRDLALAHMLTGNALAYDWLHDQLTPDERALIRAAIGFHAERMYEASASTYTQPWNNWWADSYMQNHYIIDNAGMGTAALVLLGEDNRAEKWINRASDAIARSNVMHSRIVDSSWHESIPYKDYFMAVQLPFIINLEEIEGTNLHPDAYMDNHIFFRAFNHLPNRSHTILAYGDFGWDWHAGSEQLWVMRYAAARYQDGMGEWLAREIERDMGRYANVWKTSWYVYEYMIFDEDLEPVAPSLANMGQAWHLQDLEAVIWRTGWGNDDLVFGLKSGPNGGRSAFDAFVNGEFPCDTRCQLNVGHDHADGNTFYLAQGGTWLATEAEGERRQATSYHNTLLVDNVGQYEFKDFQYYREPYKYVGRDPFIEAVASTAHFDYVAGDATRAYKISGLEDFTRHVVYVRPGYFLMLDNLESNTARTYTWMSHFDGSASVSRDGDWLRASVSSSRQLGINVISPASFNHTIGNNGKPYVHIRPTSAVQDTRFITLLYPTTSSDWGNRPTASLLSDNGQMAVVRVTQADGSYDDIIVGYNVSGTTSTGGYTIDGRTAVVSYDASGTLSKLFVAHASQLQQGSTTLVSGLLSGAQFEAAYTGSSVAVAGEFAGDVRLYAPTATSLTINGEAASYTRDGDYIRFSR